LKVIVVVVALKITGQCVQLWWWNHDL